MDADPRSYLTPSITVPLKTSAIVPLRSAGVPIGTVSVYNRRDGRPFSDHDLQLLQILGDQVVAGRTGLGLGRESPQRAFVSLRTKNVGFRSGPPPTKSEFSLREHVAMKSCARRSTRSSVFPT